MGKTITYVGLDVHKKTISVALAEGGLRGEARFVGTIPNTAGALTKLAMRLSRKGGSLRFCYEAGPCGYGVYRHPRALGHDLRGGGALADPAQARAIGSRPTGAIVWVWPGWTGPVS